MALHWDLGNGTWDGIIINEVLTQRATEKAFGSVNCLGISQLSP